MGGRVGIVLFTSELFCTSGFWIGGRSGGVEDDLFDKNISGGATLISGGGGGTIGTLFFPVTGGTTGTLFFPVAGGITGTLFFPVAGGTTGTLFLPERPLLNISISSLGSTLSFLLLREERNLTLLFISHDLSVVEYISDRIAVMYLGKIIEMLDTKKIYSDSIHPYTASLISSIPSLNISKKNNRSVLQDDISNSIKISSGCSFFTKCPIANKDNIPIQKCIDVSPVLLEKKDSHFVSCHQY